VRCLLLFVARATTNGRRETGSFIARSTWTLIEANTGIICACLPLLKWPLTLLFPYMFRRGTSASSARSTGRTQNSYPLHSNPAKQVYAYPTGITTSTKVTTSYPEKTKSRSQTLDSEEYILLSQHEQPGGITRKTDFATAYHRDGAESLSSVPDDDSAEAHV
jgi:hypothetical protein